MAELYVVNIKNSSGGAIVIEDLGVTIANATTFEMHKQYDYHEIFGSLDLRGFVAAGTLVVNNGIGDLSVANGLQWIKPLNAYDAGQDFYTKTELQTSGSSSVNWNNITNAPSFGAMSWKEPVKYMVFSTTTTSGAITGDIVVNGTNYEQYNGTTWDVLGVIATDDRVIDLESGTEDIIYYNGTSWVSVETPNTSDAVVVTDDGDGKQAQYIYDETTSAWIKIADIDFGEPNTLGKAYNQGGSGVGRTVTVDNGAVKLDATSSTYSPIELTPQASLPSSGLADGQMAIKGGILCVYDASRTKWLSVQRQYLVFGRKGNTVAQYLSFGAGSLPSNNSGLRMLRNATIVGISGQLDSSGTVNLRVRKNDTASNIASLTITAGTGNQDTTLNVDVAQTDFLQMYADNTTSVADPMVIVEIAYRP